MACPTSPPPGCTGDYRGFDKLKYQLPLYGAIISCQIPYTASVPTMGIWQFFFLSKLAQQNILLQQYFWKYSILQSCNNLSVIVFFHFYILSYFFTTSILQQFFCFKYVFSGSIHGRLILVSSEFMSQILPTPHPSCISRFFSSSQPGNIRKCPKNFSLQRWQTRVCADVDYVTISSNSHQNSLDSCHFNSPAR